MSNTRVNSRDVSRNQSTLDVNQFKVFIGDNGYEEAVIANNTGGDLELTSGLVVIRNAANAAQILPAPDAAGIANTIGLLAMDSDFVLADGETLNVNYATTGRVDETKITLPGAATLDTIVGAKTVRDILNGIGLELTNTTDNTKFDN